MDQRVGARAGASVVSILALPRPWTSTAAHHAHTSSLLQFSEGRSCSYILTIAAAFARAVCIIQTTAAWAHSEE